MKINALGSSYPPIKNKNNATKNAVITNTTAQSSNNGLDILAKYNKSLISFKSSKSDSDHSDFIQTYIKEGNTAYFISRIALGNTEAFKKDYQRMRKHAKDRVFYEDRGKSARRDMATVFIREKFNGYETKTMVTTNSENFFIAKRRNRNGKIDVIEGDYEWLKRVVIGRDNPNDKNYEADSEYIFENNRLKEYRSGVVVTEKITAMQQCLIPAYNPDGAGEYYKNLVITPTGEIYYDVYLKFDNKKMFEKVIYWTKPYPYADEDELPVLKPKKHRNKFVKNLELPEYNVYGSK